MRADCGKKRRSSSSSISGYVLERVSAFMGNAILVCLYKVCNSKITVYWQRLYKGLFPYSFTVLCVLVLI